MCSKVNKMIQDIEHKRLECNRLMRNKNKRKISKFLKTSEMIEQEAQQAKWKTSKVSRMPKVRLLAFNLWLYPNKH